jgi:hypothetical protein
MTSGFGSSRKFGNEEELDYEFIRLAHEGKLEHESLRHADEKRKSPYHELEPRLGI